MKLKKMNRTQIYLTVEEHREIKELSKKSGMSMSEIIRRRIDGIDKKDDLHKVKVSRDY